MRSLLAAWRVSLRRTRADWPIVAAAWLVTLIAAVLLAAGPIYASAASLAGLQRTLADAPAADRTVVVSVYADPGHVADIEGRVEDDLRRAMSPPGVTIVRDIRNSPSLTFLQPPSGEPGNPVPVLAARDGLPDHATLIDGSWPADAGTSDSIAVVVIDAVARELHLAVGSRLSLVTQQLDFASAPHDVAIPIRVVGIFRIDDPADPYWGGDAQLTSGIVDGGGSRRFGPFFTTAADLLQRSQVRSFHVTWRALPSLDQLAVDEVAGLRAALVALPGVLRGGIDETIAVQTGLPDILGAADRSLLVSRTAVVLLMAQLAILAGYAIVLIAGMLVDQRRIDTAMLMSRGAGTWQVALLAVAEGLLLAVPAALLAPWLVVAAVSILDVAGPLADVGLRVAPQVTPDAYLLAVSAALLCVVLLVVPATLAARRFAAEQRAISRQETRPFGQRVGIELALLAAAAIALLQLRYYGAPLTKSVQGSLGLDPLLVAAPAIGLLAGGVVALRLLPILARWAEGAVAGGRDLVASLGSRQLARRPLRYTRSALLLMLALSMGIFSISYLATWSGSQRDQAAYQAGAPIRVVPGGGPGALSGWALPAAYVGLPGVGPISPVERDSGGLKVANQAVDLLGLDADTAADVTLFRADQSTLPFSSLMASLREARPAHGLIDLPAGTAYLEVVPRLDVTSISELGFDEATGEATYRKLDPATVDLGLRVTVTLQGPYGVLVALQSDAMSWHGQGAPVVLAVPSVASEGAAGLGPPPRIAGLGVDVLLPDDTVVSGAVIGLDSVAAGPGAAGPWTSVPLADAGAWTATLGRGQQIPEAVPGSQTDGTTIGLSGTGPSGFLFGDAFAKPSGRVTFLAASLTPPDIAVPVIANRAFLAATASAPGDTVTATFDGGARRLLITGVVETFPTTDPGRPLVIADRPTLALVRLRLTSKVAAPDEWWLATAGGDSAGLAATLRASPFGSVSVVTADDRTHSLSTDPMAIGIIGALTLGFLATGLVALIGLTVSAAVSARQRRTEFALLRALGLSGGQLSAWLWLENGSLVLVSLIGGTGLGVLIGWLVLPFVTVTQQATAPVPPVLIRVPWDGVLVLDLVSGLVAGLAVVVIGSLLRRRGVGSVLRMGED